MRNLDNPEVAHVFDSYHKAVATKLLLLRELIFDTASRIKEVGELEETLKWGQPSYITAASKSGSTIRIDRVKAQPGKYAIYFNCQTMLVETLRHLYPSQFKYGGNRSILFNENNIIPTEELSHCIELALTYHLNKPDKS